MALTAAVAATIAALSGSAIADYRAKLEKERDALLSVTDPTPEQESRSIDLADEFDALSKRQLSIEARTRLAAAGAFKPSVGQPPEKREQDRLDEQRSTKQYRDQFIEHMLRGGPAPELRDVTTASMSGVHVPKVYEEQILKYQEAGSPLRALANFKGGISGKPAMRVSKRQSRDYMAFWSSDSEGTPTATGGDPDIAEVLWDPKNGYPEVPVSLKTLQASDFDFEAFVMEDMAQQIAAGLEYSYEVGAASHTPTGIFKDDSNTIQLVKSVAAGAAAWENQITYATLVDIAINQLPAEYWAGAQWIMSQNAYYAISKLVDGNSRPLMNLNGDAGITAGPALSLLGYPVKVMPFAPGKITAAGSNVPIVFGNINRGFAIREWAGIPMVRDVTTKRGFVIFKAFPFADSRIVRPKALCQLKITLT